MGERVNRITPEREQIIQQWERGALVDGFPLPRSPYIDGEWFYLTNHDGQVAGLFEMSSGRFVYRVGIQIYTLVPVARASSDTRDAYGRQLRSLQRRVESLRGDVQRRQRREPALRRALRFAGHLIAEQDREPSGVDLGGPARRLRPELEDDHANAIRLAVQLGTLAGQLQALIELGGPRYVADPDVNPHAAGFGGERPRRVPTPLQQAIDAGLIRARADGSLVAASLDSGPDVEELDAAFPGVHEALSLARRTAIRRARRERLWDQIREVAWLAADIVLLLLPAGAPLVRFLGRLRRMLRAARRLRVQGADDVLYGEVIPTSEVPTGAIPANPRAQGRSHPLALPRAPSSVGRGVSEAAPPRPAGGRLPPPSPGGNAPRRALPPPSTPARPRLPPEAPRGPRLPPEPPRGARPPPELPRGPRPPSEPPRGPPAPTRVQPGGSGRPPPPGSPELSAGGTARPGSAARAASTERQAEMIPRELEAQAETLLEQILRPSPLDELMQVAAAESRLRASIERILEAARGARVDLEAARREFLRALIEHAAHFPQATAAQHRQALAELFRRMRLPGSPNHVAERSVQGWTETVQGLSPEQQAASRAVSGFVRAIRRPRRSVPDRLGANEPRPAPGPARRAPPRARYPLELELEWLADILANASAAAAATAGAIEARPQMRDRQLLSFGARTLDELRTLVADTSPEVRRIFSQMTRENWIDVLTVARSQARAARRGEGASAGALSNVQGRIGEVLATHEVQGAALATAEQLARSVDNRVGPVQYAPRAWTTGPAGRMEITDGLYYVEVSIPPSQPDGSPVRGIVILCTGQAKSLSNLRHLFFRYTRRRRERPPQLLRDRQRFATQPLVIETQGRSVRSDPLGRAGSQGQRFSPEHVSIHNGFTVFVGGPREVRMSGAAREMARRGEQEMARAGIRVVRAPHRHRSEDVREAARLILSSIPASARQPPAARVLEARRRLGLATAEGGRGSSSDEGRR